MRSTAGSSPTGWRRAWAWGRALVPTGGSLPHDVWRRRHRGILVLLWAHVPGIVVFALARGEPLPHSLAEASLVALIATTAVVLERHRTLSTMAAALGLFTCSAVLVHLSGGVIEMHFHFFVMVAVVVLYQEWLPFLSVIGYVVLHHGIAGAIDPRSVYNHPAAVDDPWRWAAIHGAFILAMSAAGIAAWRLNEALRRTAVDGEAKLAEAQEVARLGSWEWDLSQGGLLWSDTQYRLLGMEPGRPVDYQAFLDGVHPGDRAFVDSSIRRSLATSEPFAVDFRTCSDDDEPRWLHGRGAVVEQRNGTVARMCGTTHDITERKRAEEQLAHQALHDHLTGLPNRALLLDRLDHALARTARTDHSVAVLFMDLDRFKLVNDSLGHGVGDRLLVGVAERLRSVLRPADTVARFGGDEFVVLCEDIDDEATVTALADRLLSALREPFAIEGQVFHLTASLGIALARGPASRPDALIRDADAAMYRAKERRRGGYEIFNDDTRRRAVQRLHVENGLRAALADGHLRVHYQPLVGVVDGRVRGAEALLRWQHPDHGLILPGQFIPVAEESGLIVPIGAWVLREACEQAAAWQRQLQWAEPLEISVNLSARQLLHSDLLRTVTQVLDESALDAHNVSLCIEVTESMVMEDPTTSAAMLEQLKSLGVRVGMDDFGTGYSSLAYLRRFPFDIIKIDREFVAELPGAEARAIIGSVVELARALGLTPVAEGVETPEQLGALRDVGCEVAQGYLFARPQPGPALTELLLAMDREPAGPRGDRRANA